MDDMVGSENLDDSVDAYFRHYRRLVSPSRPDRLAAQHGEALGDCLQYWLIGPGPVPDAAWDAVVMLIDRAPDDDALAFVIAGPLQDLVRNHGGQFADRLVERSRQNVGFRRAMAVVYRRQGVPADLQVRLAAVIESNQPIRRSGRTG